MKLKLALFMFAIGLGSSFAHAGPPSYCVAMCYNGYQACLLGQEPATCRQEQMECVYICEGWPLP